tara:strand:- start:1694 stop:2179 length:486 start_codon:yes stop_codon:yes gene_type:complete
MKQKNLYCDIDSTINNHWARIQKWALPSFPGNSIHPTAFSRGEIMKDKPLKGAKDTLKRLSAEYNIHFLSARNFPDAFSITKDWLDKYNFNYDSINIVRSAAEKVNFIKEKQCDIFIDDFSYGQEYGDSYKNLYKNVIVELQNMGINIIIFKGDWSKISPN